MKHKQYDMIVAKAANMRLVVFVHENRKWRIVGSGMFPVFHEKNDYFLCLPQHQEACLHWLNGGSVQIKSEPSELDAITEYCGKFPETNWDCGVWCMQPNLCVSIKPKKEKRWIGVYKNGATTDACLLRNEAENHPMITDVSVNDWQFIEIEIEVTE